MIVTTRSTLAQLAGPLHPRPPSTQAVWASEWNLVRTSNTGADPLEPTSLSLPRCCSWDILQMVSVYQSRAMARGPIKHLGIPSPHKPGTGTLLFDEQGQDRRVLTFAHASCLLSARTIHGPLANMEWRNANSSACPCPAETDELPLLIEYDIVSQMGSPLGR